VNNAYFLGRRLELDRATVWLNPLPMFHVGGSSFSALGAMCLGAAHVLFAFESARAIDLVESEGATFLPGAPTMIFGMMAQPSFQPERMASLQNVIVGTTTVPAELVRKIEASLGVRASVAWGQTECGGNATQTYPGDEIRDKAETVGKPIPHTEVRIVIPGTERVVEPGVPGEICVRGIGVMAGYFDMPVETAAVFDDGWLRTGDLGSMDERGYIKIAGRLKDVIIRGGENIYPREVEDILVEHPAVSAVAVVGLPDERLGEIVAVAVVPVDHDAPPSQVELIGMLTRRLARYKIPTRWFTVKDLPTTASGKVQKFVLRNTLEGR
jgi:fatty-acyl-CoA synthase